MKINYINSANSVNFGAKLTKSVERGFDNLGYQIKEKYGVNSLKYKKYQTKMKEIKMYCPDATLDYDADTTAKVGDRAYFAPYSFVLSDNTQKVKNFGDINENLEPELYSLRNLRILAFNLYIREREF